MDTVIRIVEWWKSTNDLSSPSHQTLIEDEVWSKLEEDLSEEEMDKLQKKLQDLHSMIVNISHEQ